MIDSPTSPAAALVARVQPDPEVWALALQEAGGDVRRLEVRSWDVVVVHNRPRR